MTAEAELLATGDARAKRLRLKPCPRCQGVKFETHDVNDPPAGCQSGEIECDCGLSFSGSFSERLSSVAKRWNTRATPALPEERERLIKELRKAATRSSPRLQELIEDAAEALSAPIASLLEEEVERAATAVLAWAERTGHFLGLGDFPRKNAHEIAQSVLASISPVDGRT